MGKKINELTELLAAGTVAASDLVVVYDASAGKAKKMTVSELATLMGSAMPNEYTLEATWTGTGEAELLIGGNGGDRISIDGGDTYLIVHMELVLACTAKGSSLTLDTDDTFVGVFIGGVKKIATTTSTVGTTSKLGSSYDTAIENIVVSIEAGDTPATVSVLVTGPVGTEADTTFAAKAKVRVIELT